MLNSPAGVECRLGPWIRFLGAAQRSIVTMDFKSLENDMNSRSTEDWDHLDGIPEGSGVYTAWRKGDSHCYYAGKAGNLHSRIRSHYSGQRGGDQFCLYVYDQILHDTRPGGLKTQAVNNMTRDWIRTNVAFKFIILPETQIDEVEVLFRKHWKPTLNPL